MQQAHDRRRSYSGDTRIETAPAARAALTTRRVRVAFAIVQSGVEAATIGPPDANQRVSPSASKGVTSRSRVAVLLHRHSVPPLLVSRAWPATEAVMKTVPRDGSAIGPGCAADTGQAE